MITRKQFGALCDRFVGNFRAPLRPTPLERESYYETLKDLPYEHLAAAARQLAQTMGVFPNASEWREAALTYAPPLTSGTPHHVMTQEQLAEHHRAYRLAYEDAPCACAACQAAGVSDKPLRFMPTYVTDDPTDNRTIQAWDPVRQRSVVCGTWVHGARLRRYYEEKAKFEAHVALLGAKAQPFVKVLIDREPGQEG